MKNVVFISLLALAAFPAHAANAPVKPHSYATQVSKQLAACWKPAIAPNAVMTDIVIHAVLAENGAARDLSLPESENAKYRQDENYRAAVKVAMPAIIGCAPYQLPKKDYAKWKTLNLALRVPVAPPLSAEDVLIQEDGGVIPAEQIR